MIKEKINSFVKHPLSISILGTLIILIFANSVRYYNIIPIVYEIHDNIDTLVSKEEELRKSIIELKENYLAKDYEGSEITVGVSTELEQNTVSVSDRPTTHLRDDRADPLPRHKDLRLSTPALLSPLSLLYL